jgi:hypothetical protein
MVNSIYSDSDEETHNLRSGKRYKFNKNLGGIGLQIDTEIPCDLNNEAVPPLTPQNPPVAETVHPLSQSPPVTQPTP